MVVRKADGTVLRPGHRSVPRGSTHVHDMRPMGPDDAPDVLKCASCAFRCLDKPEVLAKVQARTDLHMVVTKRSPADLREVFRG